jgi:glycosyltransferase involved in cell wall biosynthesis
MISAWKRSGVWRAHRLVVAGDGPELELVRGAAGHNVHHVGVVDRTRVSTLLDAAAVVIIPSRCYEGFPRLVAESFERGRPVAATALGSLRELVTADVGWTAPPESGAFAEMLSRAASDPTLRKKSAAARAVFESKLTPQVTTASLLNVYEAVRNATQGEPVPE